jgi:hypothetical protein
MRRTYENDEAMTFAAPEKQLNNDPKLLDHMVVDSGSNNHHYLKYSLLKVNPTIQPDLSNAGECLLVAILGYLREILQVEAESPNEKTRMTTKKQTGK